MLTSYLISLTMKHFVTRLVPLLRSKNVARKPLSKKLDTGLTDTESEDNSAEKQIEELKAEVHSLRVRLASSEKKQDSSLPSG